MIIALLPSERNKAIAEELVAKALLLPQDIVEYDYPQLDFKSTTDENLILLDLTGDKDLQKIYSGETIAEQLDNNHLPPSIKTIDLLFSDLNKKYKPFVTAYNISAYFKKKYNRDITVRYVSNINYDYTIIAPSSETLSWQIYGINQEDLSKTLKPTLENLLCSEAKTVIWKGKDIRHYLSDPQQSALAQPQSTDKHPSSSPSDEESDASLAISSGDNDQEVDDENSQYKTLFHPARNGSEKRKLADAAPRSSTEIKQAKVIVNREAGTIAVEMPLTPESEEIAKQFCEEYSALVQKVQTSPLKGVS